MKEHIEIKEDYFDECAHIVDGDKKEAEQYLILWKKYLLRKLPDSYVFDSEKWVFEKDMVGLRIKMIRHFNNSDRD